MHRDIIIPHDFFWSNPSISESISLRVVGEKYRTWCSRCFFYACISGFRCVYRGEVNDILFLFYLEQINAVGRLNNIAVLS